jgi:hypothetical protein
MRVKAWGRFFDSLHAAGRLVVPAEEKLDKSLDGCPKYAGIFAFRICASHRMDAPNPRTTPGGARAGSGEGITSDYEACSTRR